MDRGKRTCAWILVAGVAGAFAVALPARAADDLESVLIAGGKVHYEQYCTTCHGAGGAPGPTAKTDLRNYVARHGGKFPVSDWIAIITDARPGSVHTDVWQQIKRDQGTSNADVAARAVVGEIARYVRSVQAK
jgi:mono/diheme cytochrome c family protein